MIDTNLDQIVKPKEPVNYDPIPKGRYTVSVAAVKEWKETIKDAQVNRVDAQGRVIKDANGKPIKDLVKNLKFYNADVQFRVLEGEHKGRIVFGSLTTHPNTSFITENFLYACNLNAIAYGQIPYAAPDCILDIEVVVNENNVRKVVDKVTSVEREEKLPPRNEITKFVRTNPVDLPRFKSILEADKLAYEAEQLAESAGI